MIDVAIALATLFLTYVASRVSLWRTGIGRTTSADATLASRIAAVLTAIIAGLTISIWLHGPDSPEVAFPLSILFLCIGLYALAWDMVGAILTVFKERRTKDNWLIVVMFVVGGAFLVISAVQLGS